MNTIKEQAAELLARLNAGESISPLEWRWLLRDIIREPEPMTWADYCAISAAGYAEFDAAVGIRMVPVSNPVTGAATLAFRVGGAL